MIKIGRQPPKIYSHSIACLSDLSLINAWPWEVLPCKNTRFLGVLPEGGDLLPKLYWTFLQVPIYQHKFIVFVYVVSTLSIDDILTYV